MRKKILSYALLSVFILSILGCNSSTPSNVEESESEDPVPESDSTVPPQTWKEHWFEHDQLLQRVFYNQHIALYYDNNVDPTIEWPETYFTKVWDYVKEVYGSNGENSRLFVILHTDNYSGGHPSTYMDKSHDYRNVLDVAPYTWQEKDPGAGLNMAIHEIGHIVEGATNGLQRNPAWNIWKDSKWAEIFIYDVYKGTGEDAFADNLYNDMTRQYDDYPRENTQWFIDWFYPIYNQYGKSAVLNNFYDLLANYFPHNDDETAFSRRMNWGEFIHFWSGAADKDLKPLAQDAFGWPRGWEYELQQAREQFPDMSYTIESSTTAMTNISLDATLTVNNENTDGPNGEEGSSKLVDDDPFTKFFLRSYDGNFWAQKEFEDPRHISSYMLVSGNDYESRDPQSWTLEGSNNGDNWTTIDSRSDVVFTERNYTKDFQLSDPVSYTYYRLSITENAGSSDIQLSEWRLIQ